MRTGPRLDIEAILRVLSEHDVNYIVVGGVCGVLHGAPITTFDLDIVHSRSRDNVDRLLAALGALDAYYRHAPEKRLRPGRTHLSSRGHQLLMTRFGPLDVLGEIGKGRSYAGLMPNAVAMQVGKGLTIQVLDLAALIETKQETADEKDTAVLPILRRVLRERSRS